MLLIVDDDPHYARVLLGLARDKGFKGIVANAARRRWRWRASTCRPRSRSTCSCPTCSAGRCSTTSSSIRRRGTSRCRCSVGRGGAPARALARRVLVPGQAGDDRGSRERLRPHQARRHAAQEAAARRRGQRHRARGIVDLLSHDDIEIAAVGTGTEALAALRDAPFDCCVIDLRLPDMTGFELLERMQDEPTLRDMPIVVFTGKELTGDEESALRRWRRASCSRTCSRRSGSSTRPPSSCTASSPTCRRRSAGCSTGCTGRTRCCAASAVLVVDDDARNIFALTTVLENQDMEVLSATNGRQAIELINQTPDLSVVLMDIMMPEMDGYETMREIRKNPDSGRCRSSR